MCATFAETEVISLLAQGQDKADIAASVHRAVAARTLGLIAQVGRATPAVMTGGVAKNPAAIRSVSETLRYPIEVLDQPQIAGAYGAGLLACDEYRGTRAVLTARDAATETKMTPQRPGGQQHCGSCNGVLDGNHVHAGRPVMLDLQRND